MVSISTLVDRVKIVVLSNGTGPFVLGGAVPAFRGIEALIDGSTYSYAVENGSNYEAGTALFEASSGQLLRTPQISSNGGAAVNFPSGVEVAFTALAQDIVATGAALPIADSTGTATDIAISQRAATDAISAKVNAAEAIAAAVGTDPAQALPNVILGGSGGSARIGQVADRAAMAALIGMADGAVVSLYEGIPALTGRFGQFMWNGSDLSAQVALDPEQGVYVAPDSDPTGASGAWVRVWDGAFAFPEWFGARAGDSSAGQRTVNVAALTACAAICQMTQLGGGVYYTDDEVLITTDNHGIVGIGRDMSVISCNSATAHVLSIRGGPGEYIERPIVANLSLVREINPTTPVDPLDDRTQGHGLHVERASNIIAVHVNTAGNLMEFYWQDVLSGYGNDLFAQFLYGGAGERRYAFFVNGDNANTPPPFNTFPSPNPVFRLFNLRQSNATTAGTQLFGFYGFSLLTDMRIDGCETVGCDFSATLDGNGSNVWLENFWLDAFTGYGMRVLGSDDQNRTNILNFYAAPAAGATGEAFYALNAKHIVLTGEVAGTTTALAGVLFDGCVGVTADVTIHGQYIGVDLNGTFGARVITRYGKYSGSALAAIRITGGGGCYLAPEVVGVASSISPSTAITAVTTGLNTYDLTNVLTSAVGDALKIDGAAVYMNGHRGDDVIIAPGALDGASAFPPSPSAADRFYRADEARWYYYDGARWLSEQTFLLQLPATRATMPVGTGVVPGSFTNPWRGIKDIYVEALLAGDYVTATSNWTLSVSFGAASPSATLSSGSGAADAFDTVAVNTVVSNSQDSGNWSVTLNSGSGNIYASGWLRYRLVGV